MANLINKFIAWYMKKNNRCFFAYDTNEYLVLKRTDKKSVFFDLNGKKWSAFQRSK